VGVLLYQFLTNALPFDGKDMGAILLKIIHEPPPPLRTYLAAYPAELDSIIALALAKNPEERYATADHLAFDLMRVQEELKRDMVVEYLKSVENLVAESQWNQAKEEILQILRIDRQNSRASELLRKVEQQILTQKRSEQARELRMQAEQAIAREELGDALRYLEHAVELDSGSHELRQLRDSIAERKARADQLAALLHRAELARDTGELEEAQKAAAEALLLEHDNREAQALSVIIAREIAEHNKLKQVQGLLDEARKRIASRSFTAALDVLKKADMLAPAAPGIKELANLATSGQEQERRRRQLERFNAEVEEALSHDNFVLACAKADEGLQVSPEDRGLLKLKRLAEKQRQASEKRAYVEGQVAAARQLLDSAEPDQSLIPLEEALKKYPQEPALISMLSVVKESLARQREEQRKADCIQSAKDAIRRKAYTDAIEILEATRKEIPSSDLDDLLQFAQEEAANYATRQKIDAVADQARQFISAEEYQSAINLLAATLQEVADEELSIILEDARRRLQEFNQKVQETVTTAERLLQHDRYSEAVRFLESQFERCGKAPEVAALLEQARRDLNRVESFSITKENAREALSKDDFTGAIAILQQFREKFGETQDTRVLQQEIEATRSRAATAAMEKALPDVRMLLKVRSFDSAEGILNNLSQWSSFAAPAVKEEYESLQAIVTRFKAQRASSELAEKLNQARVSDQPTAATTASPESEAAGVEGASTDAMSRSQLEVILGEVEQIREQQIVEIDRQADAQAQQGQFDLALSTLEEGLKQFPEAEILAKARESVSVARRRVELLAQARRLRGDGELRRALELVQTGLQSSPDDSELTALKRQIESDLAKRERQEAIANATQEVQQHLRDGQTALAIEVLQRCGAQFPDDEGIAKLVRTAESRRRAELELDSIRTQAETLFREGQEEEAVSLLEKSLPNYPVLEELLASLRSKLSAKRREELLGRAVELQGKARYGEALELVQQVIRQYGSTPAAADLERTLQDQIEAERRQKAHNADRHKLLGIELQVPTAKPSKLRQLVLQAQKIAAPYAANDEIAGIALRIRQRIESQLAAAPLPKPIPVRQIAAGAAAVVVVVVGIIVVPRLFRVTTVSVEIRTDPPGASVRIGDRSCLSPNCRFELKPGQYQIETRLDGYKSAERSLTVDSGKQMAPVNLTLQPVPPHTTGTLYVNIGVPDAIVSVDGVPRGRTNAQGLFDLPLEPGSYQIGVEKPGYQTPPKQQVGIVSRRIEQIRPKLERAPMEANSGNTESHKVAADPDGKKNSGSQCQALTERMQLGESLTEDERAFLKDKCH
jgi:hypothetical protein